MAGAAGGPVKKKQRLSTMDGPSLTITSLNKFQLKFQEKLSPGALHSNRVAIQALSNDGDRRYRAYIASGRRVMAITAPRPTAGAGGERGKGGAHIPAPVQGAAVEVLQPLTLRAEVQDVQLAESPPGAAGSGVLACVDCYGRATLAHLRLADGGDDDGDGGGGDGVQSSGRMQIVGLEQLQPGDVAVEAGWAGVALAAGQPSQAAVARHFARDVTVFDGPLAVRTIHTMYRPNAVQLLSPSLASAPGGGGAGVVAVAEGPLLSVWDLRAAGRGARIARLNAGGSAGHLYCLAASDGGGLPLLGAAGADRSVLVWDPRKWTSVDRWNNCLKYAATALHFSSRNPSYCVACGQDYEVVCGRWGGERCGRVGGGRHTGGGSLDGDGGADAHRGGGYENGGGGGGGHASFRGDSRWLGMARAQGQDVVAGLTASSQLYVAELGPGCLV